MDIRVLLLETPMRLLLQTTQSRFVYIRIILNLPCFSLPIRAILSLYYILPSQPTFSLQSNLYSPSNSSLLDPYVKDDSRIKWPLNLLNSPAMAPEHSI